jgi:hypothetical protein
MQLLSLACRAWLFCLVLLTCGLVACAAPEHNSSAGTGSVPGTVLFYDDFNQQSLDAVHWMPGEDQWGGVGNNGVIPQNLSVTTVTDPATGMSIGVLDAQAHGDNYTGPIRGIQKEYLGFEAGNPVAYISPGAYGNGSVRTGAVAWTRLRYGPARYQIRMMALQQPGGETALWNYYEPPNSAPGSGNYTEIDVEMPANGADGAMTVAGLNSYATTAGTDPLAGAISCNCLPTTVPNQADGRFHLYQIDWYDGSDGSRPRIQWFIDGMLVQTSYSNVPADPAQLWVGNWPAAWSYTSRWNYASQHMYVDSVKITQLAGNTYPTTAASAPTALTVGATSSSSVSLAWQEGDDSRTIAGYNILLNGVLSVQTPTTHIELTGLTPGKSYQIAVEAVNTAMLVSSPSSTVNVTLPAVSGSCPADPTSPITNLAASHSANGGVTLIWTPPVNGTRDGTLGGAGCSITG